jgi:hypothetical protein
LGAGIAESPTLAHADTTGTRPRELLEHRDDSLEAIHALLTIDFETLSSQPGAPDFTELGKAARLMHAHFPEPDTETYSGDFISACHAVASAFPIPSDSTQ